MQRCKQAGFRVQGNETDMVTAAERRPSECAATGKGGVSDDDGFAWTVNPAVNRSKA
jgi:hypothetical protein